MKNFLTHYYHWLCLGIASIALLITGAILLPQSLGLQETFTALASALKIAKAEAPEPSSTALDALTHLNSPAVWDKREDGASPLVSRQYILKDGSLIDPLEGDVPLYPPVPNKWLIDHGLDFTDLQILDRDPYHKGFTVKEEFLAGTDPSNPKELPPLYTKLRFSDGDIQKSSYTMEFVDVEVDNGKQEFELRPLQPIPNPEKGNRPDSSSRTVAKGDSIPGAPFLKVVDYQPKKMTINDTEYDVSELTLENSITGEHHVLIKKYGARSYKPHPIELIESVAFHYQLTGSPEEVITVQRGKEFTLTSLDKKTTETYKLNDFSNGDILLGKDGKTYTVKASTPMTSQLPSAVQ